MAQRVPHLQEPSPDGSPELHRCRRYEEQRQEYDFAASVIFHLIEREEGKNLSASVSDHNGKVDLSIEVGRTWGALNLRRSSAR
jgi:hypothetical protein